MNLNSLIALVTIVFSLLINNSGIRFFKKATADTSASLYCSSGLQDQWLCRRFQIWTAVFTANVIDG